MAKDQQGLTLAGSSASAVAFDRAVADYYALGGDPVGALKRALAGDAEFVLGGVAIAGLCMIGGFRGDHPEVVAGLKAAEAGIGKASRREKLHLAAVKAWAAGPGVGGDARLGVDSRRLADRRAGAALRAGRLFLSRPVARYARFDRASVAGVGSRQSADKLRSWRLCLRARGGRRAPARGRCRPRGADPQPSRRLGDSCAGPCDGDVESPGRRHRLSQGNAAQTGVRRISWRATTDGISQSI